MEHCSRYDLEFLARRVHYPLKRVYKENNLSKKEMRNIYQKAICFVHDFPIEGNSNAVMEAMACDVPVVSTKCGLFFEKDIKPVGVYLPRRLPKHAWCAVQDVLDDTNRFSPRQFIIDNELTVQHYTEKIQELVKGACNE